MWNCRCDCGTEKAVALSALMSGDTQSCGCYRNERTRAVKVTHGETPSGKPRAREYRAWRAAKNRCYNSRDKRYAEWGGRGIRMCDEWRNDYTAFVRDMGRCPPGRSLDRINNDGHYEPGNCRWATPLQQTHNRRPYRTLKKT